MKFTENSAEWQFLLCSVSVASNLSGVVANELSGLTGCQGGGHETDETATGDQEDAIWASLRGLARRAFKLALRTGYVAAHVADRAGLRSVLWALALNLWILLGNRW